MAYTFSHPAAILPLRKHLPFSALIVGSMAPDFLYFIPGVPHSHYGHSTQGIFTFSLPASLFVLWLFHTVLKKPWMRLLPYSHQQRLVALQGPFRFGGTRRFFTLLFTAFIAIETHIWWDAFTHSQGFFPKHFSALKATVIPGYQVYGLLQIFTSVLGAVIILIAYLRWYHQAPAQEVDGYYRISGRWKITVLVTIVSLAGLAVILFPSQPSHPDAYSKAASGIMDLTRAVLVQAIALAVLWMPRKRVAPVAESTAST